MDSSRTPIYLLPSRRLVSLSNFNCIFISQTGWSVWEVKSSLCSLVHLLPTNDRRMVFWMRWGNESINIRWCLYSLHGVNDGSATSFYVWSSRNFQSFTASERGRIIAVEDGKVADQCCDMLDDVSYTRRKGFTPSKKLLKFQCLSILANQKTASNLATSRMCLSILSEKGQRIHGMSTICTFNEDGNSWPSQTVIFNFDNNHDRKPDINSRDRKTLYSIEGSKQRQFFWSTHRSNIQASHHMTIKTKRSISTDTNLLF